MGKIIAELTQADYSIPDGKYPARLIQIVQLGSRKFTNASGSEWYSPQVLLGFELPTVTYENVHGVTLSNIKSVTYFLSLNPSKNGMIGLREVVEGITGIMMDDYTSEEAEGFDISSLIGKECFIQLSGVESKGKVYQNITAVTKYEGEELPSYREVLIISVDEFKDIESISMPDWIKYKIKDSKEYQELTANNEGELSTEKEVLVSDIPF